LQFIPIPPCRLVDTRNIPGEFGGPSLQGQVARSFVLTDNQDCIIPTSAAAYSLNVTVVPHGSLNYLTVWPTGGKQPWVSTLNSYDGRIKANAAIVPAGVNGAVSFYATNTTDLVLDIDGYFAPVSNSTLAFYSLTPCRVLDTRNPNGDLGGPYLQGQQERDFPVLESKCIPSNANAVAYSMNFTVVPYNVQELGYLTVWPKGESQPWVSTLNNSTGTDVANAAIVPAGNEGEISVYPSNNTNLVVDINGYFAAAGQGGLSLYAVAPCRVLDTRTGNGAFSGELPVGVVGSVCTPPSQAQAYVFNATVVPMVGLGYLTLWPNGEGQPLVSTLNAIDTAITSNMAIVPTNNGQIDAYASNPTQLILDISSYFAPALSGNMTGTWQYSATEWYGGSPYIGIATFQQNGNTVTGQTNITGSPCFTTAKITGNMAGQWLTATLSLDDGEQIDVTGLANSSFTYMSNGQWGSNSPWGCEGGNSGTWTAIKLY